MASKKRKQSAQKPRNPHAIATILRKGGPHEKPKSTQRRQARIIIRQQLEEADD